MYIREESLEDHLTKQSIIKFDLEDLETDLDNTPTLQAYTVDTVWCFRSAVHEFLLLHLSHYRGQLRKIWLRIERAPKAVRRLSSSPRPAQTHDTFSMSYERAVVMEEENKSVKVIAEINGMSNLSLRHIVDLMAVIQLVSGEWELLNTNCRWFCAVILEALKKHFDGNWMPIHPHDKLLDFRGKESVRAEKVRELYHPSYQPGYKIKASNKVTASPNSMLSVIMNPGNLITERGRVLESNVNFPAGVQSTEAASTIQSCTATAEISESSSIRTQATDRRTPTIALTIIQGRANDFRTAVAIEADLANSWLVRILKHLLEHPVDPKAPILRLQLLETPDVIWSCLCDFLVNSFDSVAPDNIPTPRVIALIKSWITLCRLPSSILYEVKCLSDALLAMNPLKVYGDILIGALKSITMFGFREPCMRHRPLAANESIFDVTPMNVARVLRHLEIEIRVNYLKAEGALINAWQHQPQIGTIQEQRVPPFDVMVSIWVKWSIIFGISNGDGNHEKNKSKRQRGSQERINAIKYFIEMAKECRKLKDYSTAKSIMNSLHELDIPGFKNTGRSIGSKDLRVIDKVWLEDTRRPKRRSWFNMGSTQLQSHLEPIHPLELDRRLSDEIGLYENARGRDMSIELEDCQNVVHKLGLEKHRMEPRPLERGYRMCVIRIWLSIEYASNERHRLWNLADIIARLQREESIE
ncbi:hypothetical protein FRC11_004308, partial [Ceratobasidium sp. 423]